MATTSMLSGFDFGQKVDLCVRIREIIRNYPEGTSVLKELVQNADDAGAQNFTLCLDMRTHVPSSSSLPSSSPNDSSSSFSLSNSAPTSTKGGDGNITTTSSLFAPSMVPLMGPALLAYNNAQFSESDFLSIQRIGDSLKRDESLGTKTGRFGLGFNSVYHLTDVPSFVSNTSIIYFDPHTTHLPNVNPAEPGKLFNWALPAHQEIFQRYGDQFNPFRVFGCALKDKFPGTVFRLPLRTIEQAQTSRLSNRSHGIEDMRSLLQQFAQEAENMLLFTKQVQTITVMEWYPNEPNPRTLYRTQINNLSPSLRALRGYVMSTKTNGKPQLTNGTDESSKPLNTGIQPPIEKDFLLNIENLIYHHNNDTTGEKVVSSTLNTSTSTSDKLLVKETHYSTYLICNQLGGGKTQTIADNPELKHLRLVPWGGIAILINKQTKEDTNIVKDTFGSLTGAAFCFLPLPIFTGLPIHVNGYFEISSNRRDLWFGTDMRGEGAARVQWNQALLTDIIAPCYARALKQITSDTQLLALKPEIAMQYLPRIPKNPSNPWACVSEATCQLLRSIPVLWCKGVHTVALTAGFTRNDLSTVTKVSPSSPSSFSLSVSSLLPVYNSAKHSTGRWITPDTAIVRSTSLNTNPTSNPNDTEKDEANLATVSASSNFKDLWNILTQPSALSIELALNLDGAPVVTLPEDILRTFVSYQCIGPEVTPAFMRQYLRRPFLPSGTNVTSTDSKTILFQTHPCIVSRPLSLMLLRYCIQGLIDTTNTTSLLLMNNTKSSSTNGATNTVNNGFDQLMGLPLLPLADGTQTLFTGITNSINTLPEYLRTLPNEFVSMGFAHDQSLPVLIAVINNCKQNNIKPTLDYVREETINYLLNPTEGSSNLTVANASLEPSFIAPSSLHTVFAKQRYLLVDTAENIGEDIYNFLNLSVVHRTMNLRPISSLDVARLLPLLLPTNLRSKPEILLSQLESMDLGKDWLINVWKYLSQACNDIGALTPFLNTVPLVLTTTGYVVKLTNRQHFSVMIHPTLVNNLIIPASLQSVLENIGIRILDPSIFMLSDIVPSSSSLPATENTNISTPVGLILHPGLENLLQPLTIKGFCRSLALTAAAKAGNIDYGDDVLTSTWLLSYQCYQAIEKLFTQTTVTIPMRTTIRTFIATSSSLSNLSKGDILLLQSLPIWPIYSNPSIDKVNNTLSSSFVAIRSIASSSTSPSNSVTGNNNNWIIPLRYCRDSTLLEKTGIISFHKCFVRVNWNDGGNDGGNSDTSTTVAEETIAALYRTLNIPVISRIDFYTQYFLSSKLLPTIPEEIRLATIIMLLQDLPSLVHTVPDFLTTVANATFLPSRITNTLRRPCELFDPTVAQLSNLLDPDLFPAPALVMDEEVLGQLRTVGLCTSMSRHAVLQSARSIEKLCRIPSKFVASSGKNDVTNASSVSTNGPILPPVLPKPSALLSTNNNVTSAITTNPLFSSLFQGVKGVASTFLTTATDVLRAGITMEEMEETDKNEEFSSNHTSSITDTVPVKVKSEPVENTNEVRTRLGRGVLRAVDLLQYVNSHADELFCHKEYLQRQYQRPMALLSMNIQNVSTNNTGTNNTDSTGGLFSKMSSMIKNVSGIAEKEALAKIAQQQQQLEIKMHNEITEATTFRNELRSIAWIPVYIMSPHPLLPWDKNIQSLVLHGVTNDPWTIYRTYPLVVRAKGNSVHDPLPRPYEDAWLVSSSSKAYRIITMNAEPLVRSIFTGAETNDTTDDNSTVSTKVPWTAGKTLTEAFYLFLDSDTSVIKADTAAHQLAGLCGIDIRDVDDSVRTAITEVMPKLYKALTAFVTSLASNTNSNTGISNAKDLNSASASLSSSVSSLTMEDLRTLFQNKPWIWMGSTIGFVYPQRIAFESSLDIRPFLYTIPTEAANRYGPLFRALGIRQTFGASDNVNVLQRLADETRSSVPKTGTSEPSVSTTTASTAVACLSPNRLDLALALVQRLSDCIMEAPDLEILVPDADGKMVLATELVYDDAPWLTSGEDNAIGPSSSTNAPIGSSSNVSMLSAEFQFVHSKLSNKVAAAVGVASLRHKVLTNTASLIKFDLPAESFGQAESLTRRIRHILELYPEGPGVLNEFIQNADDAGARTVKIVLDLRKHGTASLLSPKLAEWQGPALLVYNDAVFTERDFINLSRIGQASKMNRLATTGRFGLGFTAAYHFGDVPQLVSGDSLVMFDPHCAYVPGASTGQPGIRIRFSIKQRNTSGYNRRSLMAQFPDQFAPLCLFGCNMVDNFPGTLFRFPLRSPTTAAVSEIKQTASSAEAMLELVETFRSSCASSLLFLRSVTRVEVYVCATTGDALPLSSGLRLLYAAEVEGRGKFRIPNETNFSKPVQEETFAREIANDIFSTDNEPGKKEDENEGETAKNTSMTKLSETLLTCIQQGDERWQTIPRFVSSIQNKGNESESVPSTQNEMNETKSAGKDAAFVLLAQTPQQALPKESHVVRIQRIDVHYQSSATNSNPSNEVVATSESLNTNYSRTTSIYLLHHRLGAGRARSMAVDPQHRTLKLLPWAGVAVRLSVKTETLDSTGSMDRMDPFTFLPHLSSPDSSSFILSHVPEPGRAYCFLPLPVLAGGLPIHVNGYFELSANRRDIWTGNDMAGKGRTRALWNMVLLADVVAPSYGRLLLEAARILGGTRSTAVSSSGSTAENTVSNDPMVSPQYAPEQGILTSMLARYYMLWPMAIPNEPWAVVVTRLYELIVAVPVLYTLANPVAVMQWRTRVRSLATDIEMRNRNNNGTPLSGSNVENNTRTVSGSDQSTWQGGSWISPNDAVLVPDNSLVHTPNENDIAILNDSSTVALYSPSNNIGYSVNNNTSYKETVTNNATERSSSPSVYTALQNGVWEEDANNTVNYTPISQPSNESDVRMLSMADFLSNNDKSSKVSVRNNGSIVSSNRSSNSGLLSRSTGNVNSNVPTTMLGGIFNSILQVPSSSVSGNGTNTLVLPKSGTDLVQGLFNPASTNNAMLSFNRSAPSNTLSSLPLYAQGIINTLINDEGIPIVRVPPVLHSLLVSTNCCKYELSPSFLRSYFRLSDRTMDELEILRRQGNSIQAHQKLVNLYPCLASPATVLNILRYVLSDLVTNNASSTHNENNGTDTTSAKDDQQKNLLTYMHGLPLIPLADGTLGIFRARPVNIPVPELNDWLISAGIFYCTNSLETELLRTQAHKAVCTNHFGSVTMDNEMLRLITDIFSISSLQSGLNIVKVSTSTLPILLSVTLPLSWRGRPVITWVPPVEEAPMINEASSKSTGTVSLSLSSSHPSLHWLGSFWRYMTVNSIPLSAIGSSRTDDSLYETLWPLVPAIRFRQHTNAATGTNQSDTGRFLLALRTDTPVMLTTGIPADVRELLDNLGIYIFDIETLTGQINQGNSVTNNNTDISSSFSSIHPELLGNMITNSSSNTGNRSSLSILSTSLRFVLPATSTGMLESLLRAIMKVMGSSVLLDRLHTWNGIEDDDEKERKGAELMELMAGTFVTLFATVSKDTRRNIRKWISDQILEPRPSVSGGSSIKSNGASSVPNWRWRTGETITDQEKLILRSLPIYETYSDPRMVIQTTEDRIMYTTLVQLLRLAPRGISEEFLSSLFYRVNDEHDLLLARCLQVSPVDEATFYTQYVIPRLATLPPVIRDTAIAKMLQNMERLDRLAASNASMSLTAFTTMVRERERIWNEENSKSNGNNSTNNPDSLFLFSDILRKLAWIPTGLNVQSVGSNANNVSASVTVLARPGDLYDPSVPELVALLDPGSFPASYSDTMVNSVNGSTETTSLSVSFQRGEYLVALRTLGLQTSLSKSALLHATKTMQDMHNKMLNLPATDPTVGEYRKLIADRSRNILRILNYNSAPSQALIKELLDDPKVVTVLRDTAWMPILQQSPHPLLPWPPVLSAKKLLPLVLPPSRVRPQDCMWLCNSSMGLLDGSLDSLELKRSFGWLSKSSSIPTASSVALPSSAHEYFIPAVDLAKQIMALSVKYSSLTSATRIIDTSVLSTLLLTVPPIYFALNDALGFPRKLVSSVALPVAKPLPEGTTVSPDNVAAALPVDPQELVALPPGTSIPTAEPANEIDSVAIEAVKTIFQNKPWIFVGDDFVPITIVGLNCPANARPYLYIPAPELQSVTPMLQAFGVQSNFGVNELVNALRSLPKDTPLNNNQLSFAIAIINLLGGPETAQDRENALLSVAISSTPNVDPLIRGSTRWRSLVSKAGTIPLPDTTLRMRPSTELLIDDATWLGSAVKRAHEHRMIHSYIDIDIARFLGAHSLRQLVLQDQASSTTLPYTGIDTLRVLLQRYTDPKAIAMDVLEITDILGSEELLVCWDGRSYASQSLLLSSLSPLQGPSLNIYLPRTRLLNEEILSLMDPAQRMPPRPHTVEPSNTPSIGHRPLLNGPGLLSLFHLGDCVQVLSGGKLHFFDPTKDFLAPEDNETKGGNGKYPSSSSSASSASVAKVNPSDGVCKCYVLDESTNGKSSGTKSTSSNGGSLSARFPDQIIPFTTVQEVFQKSYPDLGRTGVLSGAFTGTIIRVAFRSKESTLSNQLWTSSVYPRQSLPLVPGPSTLDIGITKKDTQSWLELLGTIIPSLNTSTNGSNNDILVLPEWKGLSVFQVKVDYPDEVITSNTVSASISATTVSNVNLEQQAVTIQSNSSKLLQAYCSSLIQCTISTMCTERVSVYYSTTSDTYSLVNTDLLQRASLRSYRQKLYLDQEWNKFKLSSLFRGYNAPKQTLAFDIDVKGICRVSVPESVFRGVIPTGHPLYRMILNRRETIAEGSTVSTVSSSMVPTESVTKNESLSLDPSNDLVKPSTVVKKDFSSALAPNKDKLIHLLFRVAYIDRWITSSILGAGRTRELVLSNDSLLRIGVVPLTSLSARTMRVWNILQSRLSVSTNSLDAVPMNQKRTERPPLLRGGIINNGILTVSSASMTGLPVHIAGYFLYHAQERAPLLTSAALPTSLPNVNRSSSSISLLFDPYVLFTAVGGTSDIARDWNRTVISTALEDCYTTLLVAMKDNILTTGNNNNVNGGTLALNDRGAAIFNSWPCRSPLLPTPYASVYPAGLPVYLATLPIFCIAPPPPMGSNSSTSAIKSGTFVTLNEGVFKAPDMPTGVVAYAAMHFPLFDAPSAMVKDIQECSTIRPSPRILTPVQLRAALQRRPMMGPNSSTSPPPPLPTSTEQAASLLAFCLSDLVPTAGVSEQTLTNNTLTAIEQLRDCSLIPLRNQTLGKINEQTKFLLATKRQATLLPSLHRTMVADEYIDTDSLARLQDNSVLPVTNPLAQSALQAVQQIEQIQNFENVTQQLVSASDNDLVDNATTLVEIDSHSRLGMAMSTTVPPVSLQKILSIPRIATALGCVPCTPPQILLALPDILPVSIRGQMMIPWSLNNNTNAILSSSSSTTIRSLPMQQWIYLFWREINYADPEMSTLFQDWPLIPLVTAPVTENLASTGGTATSPRLLSCSLAQHALVVWEGAVDTALERKLELGNISSVIGLGNSTSSFTSRTNVTGSTIVATPNSGSEGTNNPFGEASDSSSSSSSSSSIPTTAQSPRHRLHSLLVRCGCPLLDSTYLPPSVRPAPISHERLALSVLRALVAVRTLIPWSTVSNNDREALISLFVSHTKRYGAFTRNEYNQLRQLPLFQTVTGEWTAIDTGVAFLLDANSSLSSTVPVDASSSERTTANISSVEAVVPPSVPIVESSTPVDIPSVFRSHFNEGSNISSLPVVAAAIASVGLADVVARARGVTGTRNSVTSTIMQDSSTSSSTTVAQKDHFLIAKPAYATLYEELGVRALSEPQLLHRYVLPRFHTLEGSQQYELLEGIRNRWYRLRLYAPLVETLASLAWVPVENVSNDSATTGSSIVDTLKGSCKKPTDLIHPEHKLMRNISKILTQYGNKDTTVTESSFISSSSSSSTDNGSITTMVPIGIYFPHSSFCTKDWLLVLTDLGMRLTIDEELVLIATDLFHKCATAHIHSRVHPHIANVALDLQRVVWNGEISNDVYSKLVQMQNQLRQTNNHGTNNSLVNNVGNVLTDLTSSAMSSLRRGINQVLTNITVPSSTRSSNITDDTIENSSSHTNRSSTNEFGSTSITVPKVSDSWGIPMDLYTEYMVALLPNTESLLQDDRTVGSTTETSNNNSSDPSETDASSAPTTLRTKTNFILPAVGCVIRTVQGMQRLRELSGVPVLSPSLKGIIFSPSIVTSNDNTVSTTDMDKWPLLVRYSDCLLPDKAHLGWSLLPLLNPLIVPPTNLVLGQTEGNENSTNQAIHSLLGIVPVPDSRIILRHIRNIATITSTDNLSNDRMVNLSMTNNIPSSIPLDRWGYRDSPIEVFTSIFRWLDSSWNTLTSNDIDLLHRLPLIPAGTMLMSSFRVFFRLNEPLHPLMAEVPRAFGAFDELLKRLGVESSPSYKILIKFLSEFAQETRGERLNPNEVRAILSIIRSLGHSAMNDSTVVQTIKRIATVSWEGSNDSTVDNAVLYLLDTSDRLIPAWQSVYDDNPWLAYRLHHQEELSNDTTGTNMMDNNSLGIHIVHSAIDKNICSLFGIQPLSTRVKETIVDPSTIEPYQLPPAISISKLSLNDIQPTLVASQLTNVLVSEPFLSALSPLSTYRSLSMIGSATHTSPVPSQSKNNGSSMKESLRNKLSHVTIQFVRRLSITLSLSEDTSGSAATEDDGSNPAYFPLVHNRYGDNDSFDIVLYVAPPTANDVNVGLDMASLLARALSEILAMENTVSSSSSVWSSNHMSSIQSTKMGSSSITVTNELLLGSLLRANSPLLVAFSSALTSNINDSILPTHIPWERLSLLLRIPPVNRSTLPNNNSTAVRGSAGRPLTVYDQHCIFLSPLHVFEKGEIIAVPTNGILADNPSNAATTDATNTVVSSYIYGIVDDAIQAQFGTMSVLRINIGSFLETEDSSSLSEFIQLRSTQVYCFRSSRETKRTNNSNNSSSSLSSFSRRAIGSNSIRSSSFPISNRMGDGEDNGTDSTLSSSMNGTTTTSSVKVTNLQVNEADIVASLDDMMRRAGLGSLSSELSSQLTETLTLRASLATAQNTVVEAQKETKRLQEELETAKGTRTCPICFAADVDAVLVPCGHTICNTCARALPQPKCPFDRARITTVIPLYLPK